jgi:two-component system response regulator VicR
MRRRILIVHGPGGPSPAVRDACQASAFDATFIEGTPALLQSAIDARPVLILFDVETWKGPVEEAICHLGELRVTRLARKLVLTSVSDLEDRVDALDAGADDFLQKPISGRELRARIDAVLRSPLCHLAEEEEVQALGDLLLFRDGMEVSLGGERTKLTPTEFNLLAYFMDQAGHVLSRDELLENVWFPHSDIADRRVVDVYIWRLREKIEESPSDPRRLLTKRGGGYLLIDPAKLARQGVEHPL